jgi:predicted small secreted protein
LRIAAGTGRELRDSWPGRLAILAAIAVAAVLVSKSCGATDPDVSQDEAVAIAHAQVDYEPACEVVRFARQGLNREVWLVGLAPPGAGVGEYPSVQVDAETGEVISIRTVVGSFQCPQ